MIFSGRPLNAGPLHLLHDSLGSAAVEIAFIAIPLILSLVGLAEFGQLLWIRNSLQNAVNETAHYAMIYSTATQQQLIAYTQSQAAPLAANDVSVQVSWDSTGGVTFVTILASYQMQLNIPFFAQEAMTVVGRARTPQG